LGYLQFLAKSRLDIHPPANAHLLFYFRITDAMHLSHGAAPDKAR